MPTRRIFLKTAAAGLSLVPTCVAVAGNLSSDTNPKKPGHIKLSCNLYSFNEPLTTGQMTLEQVLKFCADLGFDAVDPTAYYFPNYPTLPADSYVYDIKRKAFQLGLDISGTGVRNDFTLSDPTQRKAQIDLVKNWIGFAARFGAPNLRVFSGKALTAGQNREEVTNRVASALRECTEYGAQYGVMLALQNHADFIETADHVLQILKMVNSEWLAVNLDIGSFRIGDPYAQIAQLAPYAATWQIKENLYVDGREVETDLNKIVRIVRDSGYRGYLPIETLGKGDPRVKVPDFLEKVRKALAVAG
ncbi:sugar phosphate isomerase/epimerase family protein [Nibrella saemangeumensis]